jgi:hypothetical protein
MVGTVSAAGFLILTPACARFDQLAGQQPYLLALALGLAGLILLERAPDRPRSLFRVMAGFVLLLLAHWVNFSLSLALGPLVFLRGLLLERREARNGSGERRKGLAVLCHIGCSETCLELMLLHLSTIFLRVLMQRVPYNGTTNTEFIPIGAWLNTWSTLARNAWSDFLPRKAPFPLWVWPLAACALVAPWYAPGVRRPMMHALRVTLVLVTAGVVYCLLTGTLKHVTMTGLVPRYLMPGVMFIEVALVVAVVAPVCAAAGPRVRQGLYVLTAPALLLAAVVGFGKPSLTRVRADLDQTLGSMTEDLLATRCTHLVGDYWDVWPAVYHANLVLHERGEARALWGVTSPRSTPTRQYWSLVPRDEMRLAVPLRCRRIEGAHLDYQELLRMHLPALRAVEVERRATIRVLRPWETAGIQQRMAKHLVR